MLTDTVNPVKQARRALHLTQERLSAITGVGTDTIVRAEQGLYPSVPPALQAYLKVDCASYNAWRKARRQAAHGKLMFGDASEFNPGEHPLAALLSASNLKEIQFCKLLCLPRAVIHKFLHQPHLCSSPPVGLLEAFKDAGYCEVWIKQFELEWQTYKQWRLGRAG